MSLFQSDPTHCGELLNGIVGETTDQIAVIDAEYRFIGFNEAYRREFEARFARAPALGDSFLDLVSDRDCALATFGPALRGQPSYTVEEGIRGTDGVHWYEIQVFPLHRDGAVAGAVHIARDITSRKLAQRQLRGFKDELERQVAERTAALSDSETLLHKVLDSLFAFVGVLLPDGTVVDVNRGPLDMAGVRAEEVIGRKFWDCIWWSHADTVRQRVRGRPGRPDTPR